MISQKRLCRTQLTKPSASRLNLQLKLREPLRLPLNSFTYYWTLSSKFFSTFHHCTLTNVHYSIKSLFLPYVIQILLLLQTLVYNPIRKLLSSKNFFTYVRSMLNRTENPTLGKSLTNSPLGVRQMHTFLYVTLDVKTGARAWWVYYISFIFLLLNKKILAPPVF